MRDYDILVIGELNVDLILSGSDVAPAFGQAEKLVDDATLTLGSSSAIFACGASRLGLRVGFVGKVGDDEFGRFVLRSLHDRGVETSAIITDPTIKTGLTVHLSRPGDRAMLTYLGSIAALDVAEVDRTLLNRTRHVHLSSYFLQRGLHPDLPHLLAAARTAGATVSLDPGWDPAERWDSGIAAALDQIDIFLPNEQEAIKIGGRETLNEALDALSRRVPTVVIKRGATGAIAGSRDTQAACAGFAVETNDTTGAGDSFDAGFLYAFLHGDDLAASVRWGCACGALSTTQVGGTAGQPTVAEVEAFLSAYDS